MRRLSRKEAGEGTVGIIALMLGFAVLYFVFFWIVGWIYETKEARVDRAWAAAHPQSQQRVINPDPGKYTVICSGFPVKTCRRAD